MHVIGLVFDLFPVITKSCVITTSAGEPKLQHKKRVIIITRLLAKSVILISSI